MTTLNTNESNNVDAITTGNDAQAPEAKPVMLGKTGLTLEEGQAIVSRQKDLCDEQVQAFATNRAVYLRKAEGKEIPEFTSEDDCVAVDCEPVAKVDLAREYIAALVWKATNPPAKNTSMKPVANEAALSDAEVDTLVLKHLEYLAKKGGSAMLQDDGTLTIDGKVVDKNAIARKQRFFENQKKDRTRGQRPARLSQEDMDAAVARHIQHLEKQGKSVSCEGETLTIDGETVKKVNIAHKQLWFEKEKQARAAQTEGKAEVSGKTERKSRNWYVYNQTEEDRAISEKDLEMALIAVKFEQAERLQLFGKKGVVVESEAIRVSESKHRVSVVDTKSGDEISGGYTIELAERGRELVDNIFTDKREAVARQAEIKPQLMSLLGVSEQTEGKPHEKRFALKKALSSSLREKQNKRDKSKQNGQASPILDKVVMLAEPLLKEYEDLGKAIGQAVTAINYLGFAKKQPSAAPATEAKEDSTVGTTVESAQEEVQVAEATAETATCAETETQASETTEQA